MSTALGKTTTSDIKKSGSITHLFSSDKVIDAYMKGKKFQKDAEEKEMMKFIKGNFSKAVKLSEELYQFISTHKFIIKDTMLRMKDPFVFDAVYIISKDSYCSDNFRNVYKKSIELKTVNNNESFHLSFTFMPYSKKINDEQLRSDGFYSRDAKKRKAIKAGARTA